MSTFPILVFGAAGWIGRYTAQSAASKGAKVYLAMRDTNKPIPGLTPAAEAQAGFQRIQADLTDPSSLTSAVQTSGAKTAFVYAIASSEDRMATAFSTLQRAGITYVVFLSAYAVLPSADEAAKLDLLPRMHAEIELALRASGIPYVAMRPAYFTSNLLFMRGYRGDDAKIRAFGVDAVHDFIAPEDIGAAAATLLTSPPATYDDDAVYLCGPQLVSVRDAIKVVGDVLGKEIEVEEMGEKAFRETEGKFMGEMVESMVRITRLCTESDAFHPEPFWKEAVANLKKLAGREVMGLREWVEKHRDEFQ